MDWFRFWSSTLRNRKAQELPGNLFKAWVNLLSIANEATPRGVLPESRDIAYALRLSVARVEQYCQELTSRGFFDLGEDGCLRAHDWERWQGVSDHSTPRVKRFRKRHETDNETDETLLDKNREEEIQIEKEIRTEQDGNPPHVETHNPDPPRVIATPNGVSALVDLFRAIPGVVSAEGDGGVVAGAVGKYGREIVEQALTESAESIGAAHNPRQYFVSVCRGEDNRRKAKAIQEPLPELTEEELSENRRHLAEMVHAFVADKTVPPL